MQKCRLVGLRVSIRWTEGCFMGLIVVINYQAKNRMG
jgi:hypothetical protein